ncbi:hypothetical protein KC887_06745 [Candidatus Kaiserbacteria bacterium]|nr:hypothetical protein [Candidatus Kaiserbacteria bacterium]
MQRLDEELSKVRKEVKPENLETDTGQLRKRYRLHERIVQHFNTDELQALMYSVGVNPENIAPFDPLPNRALEFVLHMQRHGKTKQLITRLSDLRPLVDWPDDDKESLT